MWGRMPDLVALIAGARARGQDVEANVYPYRAGQNDLASIIPPWAHEGGAEALVSRLRDPALRPRLEARSSARRRSATGTTTTRPRAAGRACCWCAHEPAVSASSRAEAHERGDRDLGKPPIDVLFELLVENGGSVSDGLLPSQRGGHAARARAALRVDRIGWPRGERRGTARGGASASALLRHVPARARRATCARTGC